MNCLASQSDPKRSGNSGPYFNVLNSDSELFRIWNNSESRLETSEVPARLPGRFDSIEAARVHCQAFFPWYNDEHRHTGLAIHTPADVHYGTAAITHQKRAGVLDAAYAATPQRFVRKPPEPPSYAPKHGSTGPTTPRRLLTKFR